MSKQEYIEQFKRPVIKVPIFTIYLTGSSFTLTEKSLSKGQRTDKKEVDALPLLLSLEVSTTWLVSASWSADFAWSLFFPETQFPFLENLWESEEKL